MVDVVSFIPFLPENNLSKKKCGVLVGYGLG